jgi:hypothetical protein
MEGLRGIFSVEFIGDAPQPKCFHRADGGRDERTKGVLQHFDSGSQTRPRSTQAACFDLAGRGIGSLPHPRLAISVGLEAIGLEDAVRQSAGRKD